MSNAKCLFSNEEYANTRCVYGYCDRNEREAATEYQRRFLNRGVADRRIFGVHQFLREIDSFPKAPAKIK